MDCRRTEGKPRGEVDVGDGVSVGVVGVSAGVWVVGAVSAVGASVGIEVEFGLKGGVEPGVPVGVIRGLRDESDSAGLELACLSFLSRAPRGVLFPVDKLLSRLELFSRVRVLPCRLDLLPSASPPPSL